MFAGNLVGTAVAVIGGFTFVLTSFMAISQSDAKKVLAYSTIANLGLIVCCGGIGTYESLWAGVFLIVFHSVSKSLMFLSVGTTENIIGSRDIEDMHGLVVKLPQVALFMAIGIAGMFLAPFGMLISKWAALRAFIDSKNILIVLFLVFGSAATLFYWTKWLGKLTAVLYSFEKIKSRVKSDAMVSMSVHAVLIIVLCMFFPVVSTSMIEPYLTSVYNVPALSIIGGNNQIIMVIMMCMVGLVPFAMRFLTQGDERITTSYMNGVNTGNNRMFTDSMGNEKRVYLTNWYMEQYFGDRKLLMPGIITGAAILALELALVLGSVL
jgi:ech hydrogenase subunit A